MSTTEPAPSTVRVLPAEILGDVPGELGVAMLRFYTVFYRCVDQVRQYEDPEVMKYMDCATIERQRKPTIATCRRYTAVQ
jgi:hypothetical protein